MVVSSVTNSHQDMHRVILQNLEPLFSDLYQEEFVMNDLSDQAKLKILFENHREYAGQSQGLRLTYRGNQALSKVFTSWCYHHETLITNGVLLELDKTMVWPYYVNRTIMVFYNETDAAVFRLSGHKLNSIQ